MSVLDFTGDAMPLRYDEHKPTEKEAKDWAGGAGWHDHQPWIPPVKTPIVYPKGKNRPTKIPMEFDWSPFVKTNPRCYPVCRHTPDQCPTKPQYPAKTQWERRRPGQRVSLPPIPNPEGHHLPVGMRFKGHSTINTMTFDDKPGLDSASIEVQAKAGYTNFSNDHAALVTAARDGLFKTDDQGRSYREGWGPGERWAKHDREHRKASQTPKLCNADASRAPHPSLIHKVDRWLKMSPEERRKEAANAQPYDLKDTLDSLRGPRCGNCLRRFERSHTKVRYCSERCRNRSEYARRSGQAGTVSPGIELTSFAVDGRRIGIDTDDLGFSRLLVGVA